MKNGGQETHQNWPRDFLIIPAVINDRDVWAAALLIMKRYGDDAMREAAAGAEAERG